MCNCAEDTLKEMRTELAKKLPSNAIKESFDISIKGSVFRLDGSNNTIPALIFDYSYKTLKVDGTEAKNRKRETVSFFGEFCSICGEPHDEENKKLWCVHILGPDSIIPATSKAEAIWRAQDINKAHIDALETLTDSEKENYPNVDALIKEWPHSKNRHEDALKDVDWSDVF